MKLPRFVASGGVRETGLVRAQDIGALTNVGDAEFRAIQQAGAAIGAVSDLGTRAFMSRQALDDKIATTEANMRAQDAATEGIGAISAYDVKVGQPLPDNIKEYYNGDKVNPFSTVNKDRLYVGTFNDYKAKILNLSKAIKNPRRRELWTAQTIAAGSVSFKQASNAKHQEHQETTILGYAMTAASNGDMELANQWIDLAEETGLIGPKRAAIERNKAADTKGSALVNMVHAAVQAGDFNTATILADNPAIPEKSQTVLRNLIEGNRKKAVDLTQEKDRDILGVALNEGTITYSMINSTSLDEGEQESYRIKMNTEAARAAKGRPIVTDQSIKGDIEREAYKIWMGAIQKGEYDQILEDARYPQGLNANPDDPKHHYDWRGAWKGRVITDSFRHFPSEFKTKDHPNRFVSGVDTTGGSPATITKLNQGEEKEFRGWYKEIVKQSQAPTINDADYDILRSLGVTELKTSQAKGLSEASAYSRGQLVEVSDDLSFMQLILDKTPKEQKALRSERKIQLENWSQFNRSMKLWQQEHPDATEGDYYIESRRKLPFYYSRSSEDILGGGVTKEKRLQRYNLLKAKANK